KTAAQLSFSDWFDSGSSVTYSYSDPVASTVTGKRYALTTPAASPASPIAVSGAATITGTYKVQFQLTFAQSGIGGDSTGTVVTGKRDALTPPATSPATPIAVSGATTITGTYKVQFQLFFEQSGIGGDPPSFPTRRSSDLKTAAQLSFSDWVDSGSSVTYSY